MTIYVHVCWLKWVTPVLTAFFNTTPYHMNLVVYPGINRITYLHVMGRLFFSNFVMLYFHVFLNFICLCWSGMEQNLSYKLGYSPGYNLAYLHVIELNLSSPGMVFPVPCELRTHGHQCWKDTHLKLAVLVIVQTELKPGLIFGNRSKPKTGIYFESIEPRTRFLVLFKCEIGSKKRKWTIIRG